MVKTKSKKAVPALPIKAFNHSVTKMPWPPPSPLPRKPPAPSNRKPKIRDANIIPKMPLNNVLRRGNSLTFKKRKPAIPMRNGIINEDIPNQRLRNCDANEAPTLPPQLSTLTDELEKIDCHSKLWSDFHTKRYETKAITRYRAKSMVKSPRVKRTLSSLKKFFFSPLPFLLSFPFPFDLAMAIE